MIFRKTAAAALCGLVTLAGCTDPARLTDSTNPNQKRDQGILFGAGMGALVGNLVGGDTKATLAGAVVGGVAGGVIGNNLDKQAAELRQSLASQQIGVTNTGDSLVVTLPQDVTFDTDSFAVRPSLMGDLNAVAANLKAYPASTVKVIGHTDNEGDAAYNQTLSERRAGAVAGVLIGDGVEPSRIVPLGQGETMPIASNLTPEGRAQNRRVEIVIVPTT